MVKKVGRPKGSKNKKRKKRAVPIEIPQGQTTNTGKYAAYDPNGGDLGRGNDILHDLVTKQEIRASKNSYVLILGTRVPIQDLSHESLCDRYTLIQNETSNLRRELRTLEELESNLRAEKFYRNL